MIAKGKAIDSRTAERIGGSGRGDPRSHRLDRYERRAWSRQKRAMRFFMNIKLMKQLGLPAKPN
jgi:hypothetical protein